MNHKTIKNITITDNRGTEVEVTGVLSSNQKFVVASIARTYVNDWKASANNSGNLTRQLGFGDMHLFIAENVKDTEEENVVTADLHHVHGPLSFRANQIKYKNTGETTVMINSYLNEKVSQTSNAKTFEKVTNPEIKNTIPESFLIAARETKTRKANTIQKEYAAVAKEFADLAEKFDSKKKKSTTYVEHSKNTPNIENCVDNADNMLPM